ncbi:TetR/AcrR family transcriptional regulator [Subtercola boreus]|nr:TetR family transcriptional regulator [Subtercola boreus]
MNRPLTRKGEATRGRIVEAAASVVITQGTASAGLEQIRAASGTSGSQLFHYFPGGKAQLMLAVAEFEAEQVLEEQRPDLDELTTWDAWRRWSEDLLAAYEAKGSKCSIAGLMSQLDPNEPEFRAIVIRMYDTWEAALARGISALQADGSADTALDPADAAASLLAGIQGGIVMMLSTGSTRNLKAALDAGLERLKP